MTSDIRETPCFVIEEPKVRSPKRSRLDESTAVVVADSVANGENHDDDNGIAAATKRMKTAMEAVIKEAQKSEEPEKMFAIFVKQEMNDDTGYAYAAPIGCASAKKIRALLTRCIGTRTLNDYHGPYDYQLISILDFVVVNPDADDSNFLIDFAGVLVDEAQQDEKTQSGSESVDADMVNVKKVIGDELQLWRKVHESEFSSCEENPKFLYQTCFVDGFY